MHKVQLVSSVASLILLALSSPTPVVLSAYVDGNTLRFEAPTPQPWDRWLPTDLRLPSLAKSPVHRQELFARRSEYGSTEVALPLPLPRALAQRYYYLVNRSGQRRIRPTGLLETARIIWRDTTDDVQSVETFGDIVLRQSDSSLGGFILTTESPLNLRVTPSRWSADDLLAPAGGTYFGQGTSFRTVVAQFEITAGPPASAHWVFVQWLADTELKEIGCEYRFALFRLEPGPSLVRTTDYGCDV